MLCGFLNIEANADRSPEGFPEQFIEVVRHVRRLTSASERVHHLSHVILSRD